MRMIAAMPIECRTGALRIAMSERLEAPARSYSPAGADRPALRALMRQLAVAFLAAG